MNIKEKIEDFRTAIDNGDYVDASDIYNFLSDVEKLIHALEHYGDKNNWLRSVGGLHIDDLYDNKLHNGYDCARIVLGLDKDKNGK